MRSARASLAPGRPLPVLVLAVLLVDSLGQDFSFQPEWDFDSYEITIPKKLSARGGQQGASKRVSYLLQVKGKKHVLQLWPKRFLLPRHLQVFSFTQQGERLEEYPYIPSDCNYVGVVEGTGESEATVSTCMGVLRGILKIDAQRYQIEPLKASSTFEHVVYLLKEQAFPQHLCGLTRKEGDQRAAPRDLTARLGDLTGIIRHQRYLELALIFDHERYLFSNSNLSEVTSDAILLTSIADTYFQELHIRIQLGTLEVWTDQNKVEQRRVEHFPPKCPHVCFQIFSPLHSVLWGEEKD